MLIHEMLARSANDRPDKSALVWRGETTTYERLNEASDAIAHFLRNHGVARGSRVAILSIKCPAEAAIIYGIAKAGAVLVHINPTFRQEQVAHVLTECTPTAMFFSSAKAELVRDVRARGKAPDLLVAIDEGDRNNNIPAIPLIDSVYTHHQNGNLPRLEGDDPAAIIYTSGTTAMSKGITVTHRILSDATTISTQVLGNVETDRLISLTPFSFDGSLSQLFTAVLVGGTVVLQHSLFPADVVKTLIQEEISGCHAMPSFWLMMLGKRSPFDQNAYPALRYISLVGEVFPEADLHRLRDILKTTDVYMMYGTTEAFRSTCLLPKEFARKYPSLGRPLPGVTIQVTREDGTACSAREVGEIVHDGAFVSPGYWKRAAPETFRNGRVHTGDLGWIDEDGYLYFVGRKDNMIKRMGYQVCPEDIEACLHLLDGVSMASVVPFASDASNGLTKLRAYIVTDGGASVSQNEALQHCRHHLPAYMVPDEIVFRADLPTTATAKVDRNRLIQARIP